MNTEQRRSIDVLDRSLVLRAEVESTELTSFRQPRLDELIGRFIIRKRPPMEYMAGWHFCVPGAFLSALDIEQTARVVNGKVKMTWTQGSRFHFEEGDTIYDSIKAYLPWKLRNFQICLDIQKATPAKQAKKQAGAQYAGTVIFDVRLPNTQRTQLEKCAEVVMTQDEFVRTLILGPPSEWDAFLPVDGVQQRRLPF